MKIKPPINLIQRLDNLSNKLSTLKATESLRNHPELRVPKREHIEQLKQILANNPKIKTFLFNNPRSKPITGDLYHNQTKGRRLPRKKEEWVVHAGTLRAAQDRLEQFNPKAYSEDAVKTNPFITDAYTKARTIKLTLAKKPKIAGAGDIAASDALGNNKSIQIGLRRLGYDAIYYKNAVEDHKSISTTILNPKKIKVKEVKKAKQFSTGTPYTHLSYITPETIGSNENDMLKLHRAVKLLLTIKKKDPDIGGLY